MNKNNLIASFQIDHLTLLPGLYLSRSDKGVLTYDLRFTAPNREPVLSTGIGHAIEHLAATYFRNSTKGDKIV
ncbi:MAG: S-ribosylhomocysteine lyase, partial [Clostridia bacterium]|nr:S-ribosylhomocysteine lyase [Clostridia bacterium]